MSSNAAAGPYRYASKLYDDLWFPDEALEVRERVRAFCERHVRPVAHELNTTPESEGAFPMELMKMFVLAKLDDRLTMFLVDLRDEGVTVGEIYEGANEVQRLVIAREIFGRE